MNEPKEALTEQARAVIAEEEALLARVLGSLQAARQRAGRSVDRSGLVERLTGLRDEATTAVESDLPALFQQLDNTRALLERQDATNLPEPNTPYFAHLRLRRHEGEGTAQEYLLGRTTFTDSASGVRIIDWRFAPVARVFYGYEEGDDYEEYFGDRLAEGVVEARRLVVIERGVLTRIRAGALHLERTAQRRVAARWAPPPCSPAERGQPCARAAWAWAPARRAARPLRCHRPARRRAVRGPAGRRGSAAARARAARAAARRRWRCTGWRSSPSTCARPRLPSRMKVLVPEEGLARLSKRLLAPLELRNVSVETLDAWAYATACTAFGVKSIALAPDTPALTSRLKRHPALKPVLERRLAKSEDARIRPSSACAGAWPRRSRTARCSARWWPPRRATCPPRPSTTRCATPCSSSPPRWRWIWRATTPRRCRRWTGSPWRSPPRMSWRARWTSEDLPLLLYLKVRAGHLGTEPWRT